MKLDEEAKEVFFWTMEEAVSRGYDSITEEHLLLGLLKANGAAVRSVLELARVERAPLWAKVEAEVPVRTRKVVGRPSFSPGCLRIFERAKGTAETSGIASIGGEHILLALLNCERNVAGVLGELRTSLSGLYPELVRQSPVTNAEASLHEPLPEMSLGELVRGSRLKGERRNMLADVDALVKWLAEAEKSVQYSGDLAQVLNRVIGDAQVALNRLSVHFQAPEAGGLDENDILIYVAFVRDRLSELDQILRSRG